MDELDRAIVNSLQDGFPLSARPFLDAARALDTTEEDFIFRVRRMLDEGTLTRFGPLYDVERGSGAFMLAAMQVPAADFDRVATIVNRHPEVAHNYQREHRLNMWFVLATEKPEDIATVIAAIERETGVAVLDFPKRREYFLGLKLAV
ncbi:MAG: Lrp/AsnC family transcriptional regulator [Betaproteobacteria bacterium]